MILGDNFFLLNLFKQPGFITIIIREAFLRKKVGKSVTRAKLYDVPTSDKHKQD